MNFDWFPKSMISKRVEQLNFHKNIQLGYKVTSPTIDFLKNSQKVKKTKEYYENNLIAERNIWMYGRQSPGQYAATNYRIPAENYNFKADLIRYEKGHLHNLEIMSSIYAKVTQSASGYMSKIIRNLHISLSGCLTNIKDLHKFKIMPYLQKSSTTYVDILSFILHLIESSDFYCYVKHTMLYNSTFQWQENFTLIFEKMCMQTGVDYTNLEIDDIIRLYKDWTADISGKLMAHPREHADELALCFEVEQKLNHLLSLIDDAKKIAYIKEVSQNNIEAIEKLHHIMERKQEVANQFLILFPRYDVYYGYRSPIDLLKLGQFVRVWNEKSMISETSNCYYDTNLFIFERCIIYTIVINKTRYLYNGHFWIKDCHFESVLKNDKSVVLAILTSGNRQLILDNEDFVSALMRLHKLHKYDENEAEIDIPFDSHVKILSKIENANSRRLTLAYCD